MRKIIIYFLGLLTFILVQGEESPMGNGVDNIKLSEKEITLVPTVTQ
jgi:hypothetical protein